MGTIHHAYGCNCTAPACVRARRKQYQYDWFIAFVGGSIFALVAIDGFVRLYRSGLLSWLF